MTENQNKKKYSKADHLSTAFNPGKLAKMTHGYYGYAHFEHSV